MTEMTVYQDDKANQFEWQSSDFQEIARVLKRVGVVFQRWSSDEAVSELDSQLEILDAYITKVDQLMVAGGYSTVDVIRMTPDHPEKMSLREKFLQEHTHSEDEVRFFVKGEGLFTLHIEDKVYQILCCEGDLISVPANTPHWFDMGPEPSFIAIRFFNNPDGWVANYTGSDIAEHFSRFERAEEEVAC